MTAQQIKLVQESWAEVKPIAKLRAFERCFPNGAG
jgi:hypothetical protein